MNSETPQGTPPQPPTGGPVTFTGAGRALVIYGGGGHGMVVADAAAAAGWKVIGFVDDNPRARAAEFRPILEPDSTAATNATAIVAIGDNCVRQRAMARLVETGRELVNVIHPSACVSPLATFGRGVFIGPRAVVNAGAVLGDGAIINSGAIVEHHCHIGAFAHIAPGAVLGGAAQVGALTLVGLGASVLPVIRIGERSIVGAGAVLIGDIGDHITVVGVPARAIM
jgi:sugar O-acyltransferase (sialic acid O-acetyltransferase NeuD family)